jgi:hypothetical protein
MKRIVVVLICFVGVFFLLLALYFPPQHKGEIVETWDSTNTPFKIRVNNHIERGGFMPGATAGAYYDFQTAAVGSDDWREIMTFRHDDPIDIPKNKVHFANEKVASVFMGWMYAVTTDGGNSWRVSKMWDFLPDSEKCLYGCIEDLRIETNGRGEAKLNIIASPKYTLKILETNDFGKTWLEKYRESVEQFNGREGETSTLLLRFPLNFSLCVGGFAPRHLKHSPPCGEFVADSFLW